MATRAALLSEISAQLIDNTQGLITPAILRGVLNDMVSSTVTLDDSSTVVAPFVIQAAAGAAFLTLNPTVAAQQAGINFLDAGVAKWQFVKQPGNNIILYDAVAATAVFTVSSNDVAGFFQFLRSVNITTSSAVTAQLTNTNAGGVGVVTEIYHNSASPAANDVISDFVFYGNDSGLNKTRYGDFAVLITDPTDGSEDGLLQWNVVTAGVLAAEMYMDGSALFPVTTNGLALGKLANGWSSLTISSNTATLQAPQFGEKLHIGGPDASGTGILVDTYGAGANAQIVGRRALGTAASPSAINAADLPLLQVGGTGFGSTVYATSFRASFQFRSAAAWTDASQGAYAAIYTNPIGSASLAVERMRIDDAGLARFGASDPINKSAFQLSVLSSLASNCALFSGSQAAGGMNCTIQNEAANNVANVCSLAFALNSTTQMRNATLIQGGLVDVTDATRTSKLNFLLSDAGSGLGTRMYIHGKSVVIGDGASALATNATSGFLYIPTCAGTPSGVPGTQTGTVAMVYDTTNNKLYIYNGAWKGGTAPGAWS